jgi:hypothetical protein
MPATQPVSFFARRPRRKRDMSDASDRDEQCKRVTVCDAEQWR